MQRSQKQVKRPFCPWPSRRTSSFHPDEIRLRAGQGRVTLGHVVPHARIGRAIAPLRCRAVEIDEPLPRLVERVLQVFVQVPHGGEVIDAGPEPQRLERGDDVGEFSGFFADGLERERRMRSRR